MAALIRAGFNLSGETQPLLATAIHAGHYMPPELLAICGIGEAQRTQEEDPFTDEFAALFPNNIILHTSRFAVDLNRNRSKAVYLQPEDCWGLPARTAEVPPETLSRLYREYDEWYRHLDYALQRLWQHNGFMVVLDLHSYNHRRGGPNADPDPQEANPDIIIGRGNIQEKHYPAAAELCRILDGTMYQGKPLDCRMDVKFTGGFMSRHLNAKYPDRLICLAVEFKKTFMDEWTGVLDRPALDGLKAIFSSAVRDWMSGLEVLIR